MASVYKNGVICMKYSKDVIKFAVAVGLKSFADGIA